MAQTATRSRRTSVRGYTKRDGTRVSAHSRKVTMRDVGDAVASSLSGAGSGKSKTSGNSPLAKAKAEYLKRETISAAVESSPVVLAGGVAAILVAPLALPVVVAGAGGYIAAKRRKAGKQEITSMAQAKSLPKKRWQKRGKKLQKAGMKALKAEEKRQEKRRAKRKQQMMILAYQVIPGLRWWHGRRWEGDRVRLKKQQKVQEGEVDWLNDKRASIMARHLEIEEELALGVEGDPSRLEELQDAQKAEVEDWYGDYMTFQEREEIFAERHDQLKARGKALKAAGYQKKLGGKKEKKGKKKSVFATSSSSSRRDPTERIKSVGEAPGKGAEKTFDTTWDLLFEDWNLPKAPIPLPF